MLVRKRRCGGLFATFAFTDCFDDVYLVKSYLGLQSRSRHRSWSRLASTVFARVKVEAESVKFSRLRLRYGVVDIVLSINNYFGRMVIGSPENTRI